MSFGKQAVCFSGVCIALFGQVQGGQFGVNQRFVGARATTRIVVADLGIGAKIGEAQADGAQCIVDALTVSAAE